MWPIAGTDRSSHIKPGLAWLTVAMLFATIALFFSGCGAAAVVTGFSPGEKIAYLKNDGARSSVEVASLDGGGGQTYLEWPESSDRFTVTHTGRFFTIKRPAASGDDESRRFSFSNDGRWFALSPKSAGGEVHPEVVATDGGKIRHLPAGSLSPAFSPDSAKVAYWQVAQTAGSGRAAVIDLAGGGQKVFSAGLTADSLFWSDDRTIIYHEQESGSIVSVDVNSGAIKPLTSPGREFSVYAPPASYPRGKLALMDKSPRKNIWSLDLTDGRLYQVSNNSRWAGDKRKAAYLPGRNLILFQEPQGPEPESNSDLCLISDDASSEYQMLTRDFFFDGLYTVSPATGRIAWQHAEEEEISVWSSAQDGSGWLRVEASETAWIGDPNFVSAAEWREPNPLEMTVDGGGAESGPVRITVSNPSGQERAAVLRLFPGEDLELLKPSGEDGFTLGPERAVEMKFTLEAGDTRVIEVPAAVKPVAGGAGDATLLVTLFVEGTPPRMAWRDLAAQ